MAQSLDIQELAIVITVQHHNPAILCPEFLKFSGVVPAEWELARSPVANIQAHQVVYQNGLSITAQADRILFIEPMAAKEPQELYAARTACQYMKALPHADYQAMGINFRGVVPFDEINAAHSYLMNTLLAPGLWQEYGQDAVKASINIVYTLERGRLFLSVSEATLQLSDDAPVSVVLFSGNFEYHPPEGVGERRAYFETCLEQWHCDLECFKDLINTRFLRDRIPTQSMHESSLLVLSTPESLTIGV